jgi:large subunit ribosomal protein L10
MESGGRIVAEGTRVKPEKVESVTDLHAKFARAISAVLTDFRGLTVQELTDLRQQLREASLELAVVKNTLARLAVKETPFERLSPYLKGPTSITFSYRDAVAPAKVLSAYVRRQPKLAVRAGIFEGEVVPAEKIAQIAELPPRDVLLAQALAAMQGPLAGLVWTLQGVVSMLIGTLQAIHDKKAQG